MVFNLSVIAKFTKSTKFSNVGGIAVCANKDAARIICGGITGTPFVLIIQVYKDNNLKTGGSQNRAAL